MPASVSLGGVSLAGRHHEVRAVERHTDHLIVLNVFQTENLRAVVQVESHVRTAVRHGGVGRKPLTGELCQLDPSNIQAHGVARAVDAPLANHSDPTIKGCRGITNCSRAEARAFARIDGLRAPASHNDVDILPLLERGPMAVSIDAGPYNGYHGGILNCSASPPFHHVDHANALVGFGIEPAPAPCAPQPANASYATYYLRSVEDCKCV